MHDPGNPDVRLVAARLGVDLTRREEQVFRLVIRGATNKEIAAAIGVSPRTAKFHVSNLLQKFGVERRTDLMLMWISRQHISGRS